jgi:hypothetical protein
MRKVAFMFGVICAYALGLAEEPRPSHPVEKPLPPENEARPWETTPPARHLPPPAQLSPAVRSLLHDRMARHGNTMTDLVQSVILLDYDKAARLAREIAEEPRLARPLTKDASELNAQLPDRFFELQDALHTRASHLAEIARTRNGAELAPAFGQLAETCVSCHRVYEIGRAP